MNRLDRLDENNLTQRVTDLRSQIDALKASAQPLGSTSVVLNRIATGNASDFHVPISYRVLHGWQITFTPNLPVKPNLGLIWHIFFNIVNLSGSGLQYVTGTDLVSTTNNVWVYNFWAMGSNSGSSGSFDILLRIYSIGVGSISVSQIQ